MILLRTNETNENLFFFYLSFVSSYASMALYMSKSSSSLGKADEISAKFSCEVGLKVGCRGAGMEEGPVTTTPALPVFGVCGFLVGTAGRARLTAVSGRPGRRQRPTM